MGLDEQLQKQLTDLVRGNRVVLFMKGTRRAPQCGFSAQVVEILDELLPDYEAVDVLSSRQMRSGVKQFSSWPTFPQLYVDGKLIGGCDIVRKMKDSGELDEILRATRVNR